MKAKRRALIPALLSAILALGLLARSSTRLAVDLLYPFSTADTAAHELRIFWKQLGEGICGTLYAVYLLGLLVLLCLAWTGTLRARCSSALLFLLSQGGLALLCTLPFAWVDSRAFFDYLFPLWGLCGSLLLFFLLYEAVTLVRARRR